MHREWGLERPEPDRYHERSMDHDTRIMGENARFKTTRWSLVEASRGLKALETLVFVYWKPLYFFARQHGFDNETAKDVVQSFFSVMIERDILSKADPARGRFRTFLLTALSNYLKDWSKAAARQKRGGGHMTFSLDFARGETEFAAEIARGEPPEKLLDRAWARSLWEQSLSELKGDPGHLEAFRLHLGDANYAAIAARTGLSESAAKSAVHRLKGQLRDIIVGHLRTTVSSDGELQAELADFVALLP